MNTSDNASPSVQWDAQSYIFKGERDFLVSGEFHYFRVPQQDWRRRLGLWKEAGGNAIATYVPWLIHEPQEGQFTFGPKPWLQIEQFLEVCADEGIEVLVRPGPYQYSELVGAGIPPWVFENYPEIMARDMQGNLRSCFSASYLHPVFLDKVRLWFDQICPILARYTVSNGGPVSMVQFDNELMGLHEWYGGWDYNTESMGIGVEGGRYPDYLQKKFGSVDAMNKAYKTDFCTFSEVMPVENKAHADPATRRRVRDYMLFYFQTVAEYSQILMQMIRERGLDVPFVHNSANPSMNSYFKPLMDQVKGQVLLGSDHYYNLGQQWEQNNPTPQYAVKCFLSMQMLQAMNCPPSVFEMPGGSPCDWPPITSNDLRCCYWLHAAMGVKGINYYIYTGGPNPPKAGVTSDIYDFNALISADGTIREQYWVQKEFAEFLHANRWLAQAQQVTDFYIGLDWNQAWGGNFDAHGNRQNYNLSQSWECMRRGVLTTALCGSWSPSMLDLSNGSLPDNLNKPLWVVSGSSMPREIQQTLTEYVKAGGTLILGPVIPHMDENFGRCSILSDFLEGAATEVCPDRPNRLNVGDVENVFVTDRLFHSAGRPEAAITIATEVNSGKEIGWKLSFDGGGKVIWLGLSWIHSVNSHCSMLEYVLGTCGLTDRAVSCSNPNVWSFLRSDGKRSMLFLINLFSNPMDCRVNIGNQLSGCGGFACERTLQPWEVAAIPIDC